MRRAGRSDQGSGDELRILHGGFFTERLKVVDAEFHRDFHPVLGQHAQAVIVAGFDEQLDEAHGFFQVDVGGQ